MTSNRVAALYDIHANLPALEAVLTEVEQVGVERVVVGGDIFPGPLPLATFARLRELQKKIPTDFIYGNCEVAVLLAREGKDPGRMPEPSKEAMRWTAQQLSVEQEHAVRAWPKTLTLEIEGLGEALFCHGTPRDENEIFTKLTPESAALPAFAGVNAKLIVCGHTHMQFDRVIGNMRVINAGSVGMPFGKPGADWLLLGRDVGNDGVELRHTDYDLQAAAARVRVSDYPMAEEFAEKYMLHPPAEKDMLGLFTKAGMK